MGDPHTTPCLHTTRLLEMDERLRNVERTAAAVSKVVTGNGDPESGLTAQVRLVRARTHDIANHVQGLEARVTVAVQERDHKLEQIRGDLERHEEECMSKEDAQELVKATVTEMRAGGDRRLNMWLVFVGVLIMSTVGPTVVAIVTAAIQRSP